VSRRETAALVNDIDLRPKLVKANPMSGVSSRTVRACGTIRVLTALVLGLCTHDALADDHEAEAKNTALLALRILSYDHNLKARAGDRVTVLVVSHDDDDSSERVRDELVGALNEMKRVRVAGMPIAAVSLTYSDAKGLADRLEQTHPAAVFVCPGLDGAVASISAATRRASALTLTHSEAAVNRGLSVAIVRRDGKDRIIINLPAARAEGARLDAGLLQLATIIGDAR
jgi:preprotein translocase subunit SecD